MKLHGNVFGSSRFESSSTTLAGWWGYLECYNHYVRQIVIVLQNVPVVAMVLNA